MKKICCLVWIALSMPTWALGSTPSPAGAALSDTGGERTPLEVRGQSRNLNMTLVLRNDKDKIKFVKIRENYRQEILGQTQGYQDYQGYKENH